MSKIYRLLNASKFFEVGVSIGFGLIFFFLKPYLFQNTQGVLLDPMVGLVVGLAWRSFFYGAGAVALLPLVEGWATGFPQSCGLLLEGFLTVSLLRSVGEAGGIGLRGMILIPLATGVTVAGVVATQIFSAIAPFDQGFGSTWASQALGVLALAPLVAKIGGDFLSKLNRFLFLGWVFLTSLLFAVGKTAMVGGVDPETSLALALIPLIILFWQSMRFGAIGATTSCFILAIISGLAWADTTPSFSSGLAGTILCAIFGTAHVIAALRDERNETLTWTGQAAESYQVIFWRWQRGHGIEWDDEARAHTLGLKRAGLGWQMCEGWVAHTSLPRPEEVRGPVSILIENVERKVRWLEFSGSIHTRDASQNPSTFLGVVVDRTAFHQAEEEKNTRLVREGELRALRAQLQPHVVFNALNRIASLTMSEPEVARDLIVRLSRLLRAALLAGEKDSVSLSEEVSLVEDCVVLEGAGYGGRLKFHNEIPSDIEEKGLPPLALLSLVNGAIRRGVGMRKKGATIVLSMPSRRVFRVAVTPPVDRDESSEYSAWPDPIWVERLQVEQKKRARIEVSQKENHISWAELVLEKN